MEYLNSLFISVRVIIRSISYFVILLDFLYLLYIFKEKHNGKSLSDFMGNFFSKKSVIIISQIILILGILFSPSVFGRFENTNIGSILEKETYQERYYAYIRTDNGKTKAYRVEADIIRSDYGYTDYIEGEESFVVQGRGYFVLKIHWENGGYLTFIDEGEFELIGYPDRSARIYPGVETKVRDYKGNCYYITLTTEKVKRN